MNPKLDEIVARVEGNRHRILAVLVHLNDTYLIEERSEHELPGFPRAIATIRSLRNRLRNVLGRDLMLVLHSGDFLGPSRTSKQTKGKTMVEALNRLGLDWCVLGNHEFDYGESSLLQRMREARFRCTIANVRTDTMLVQPWVLWPNEHDPLVALTGVVSESVHRAFPANWKFTPAKEALERFREATASAAFHVVLTHATRVEDRELRKGQPARTLILGGHDHDIYWTEDDGHPIMKNLSNLQTMRVVLLFAGGPSPVLRLYGAHEELYKARSDACFDQETAETFLRRAMAEETSDPAALRFPEHCEDLLRMIHPMDAQLFRTAWGRLDQDSLSGDYTLEQAIGRLRFGEDFETYLIKYEDHEIAAEEDLSLVERPVSEPNENVVVRDFSTDYPGGFDVREEQLRRAPNLFGRLVAECVRREGKADLAILNSGTFRLDARLPPVLRARDLKDCFLYDHDGAIVVLDLPSSAVDCLLRHGLRQEGTGAFPQTSPADAPAKEVLRVAIASYLVEDEASLDSYNTVLADALGIEIGALSRTIKASALTRFGIVSAVRDQAQSLERLNVVAPVEQKSFSDEFILLCRTFRRVCEAKEGRTVEIQEICEMLSSDRDLRHHEMTASRNAVREWIRALPKVAAAEGALSEAHVLIKDEESGIDYEGLTRTIQRSYDFLRDLIATLAVHPDVFRDRCPYDYLLNHAAVSIAEWRV